MDEEELIKAQLKPRKAKKEWKMFALLGFVMSCVFMVLVTVIVFPLLDNYDIPERVKGMIVVMILVSCDWNYQMNFCWYDWDLFNMYDWLEQ